MSFETRFYSAELDPSYQPLCQGRPSKKTYGPTYGPTATRNFQHVCLAPTPGSTDDQKRGKYELFRIMTSYEAHLGWRSRGLII